MEKWNITGHPRGTEGKKRVSRKTEGYEWCPIILPSTNTVESRFIELLMKYSICLAQLASYY